jgi:hypothetical protein
MFLPMKYSIPHISERASSLVGATISADESLFFRSSSFRSLEKIGPEMK